MLIERDLTHRLKNSKGVYAQVLIGPRQCGKSTLFEVIDKQGCNEITLDDFQARLLAEQDPALFFAQNPPPLIIDEVQYAPNLFPEIKKIIDELKKKRLRTNEPIKVLFYLTGSNQILMDEEVKESLVGRASYFNLNTLSVHEIKRAFPEMPLNEVMFKGGWPELYINSELNPVQYLNDYIRNYVEKDIVVSAGITKKREFHTVLGMLAARTGSILNNASLAKDSGVKSNTVAEWVSVLERTELVYILPSMETNLNKRLTKTPKVYFLDTGLATRLQGWMDLNPLLASPQAGGLFETLVLAEIVKCMMNFGKNWKLSFWRTKEQEEVDFILEKENGDILVIDAKLAIHGASAITIPQSLCKAFPKLNQILVVTYGGKKMLLSKQSTQIPLSLLTKELLSW